MVPVDGDLACGENTRTQDGDICKLLDGGDMDDESVDGCDNLSEP